MVSNSPKRREKTGDGELEAGNAETQGHSLGCEGKDTDGEGARRMQDQASQPSLQASEPLPGVSILCGPGVEAVFSERVEVVGEGPGGQGKHFKY